MREESTVQGGPTVQARAVVRGKADGRSERVEVPAPPFAAVLGLTLDPIVREHLLEIALQHGYGFRCVVTVGEALRIMGSEPPGLMVIDIDASEGRALVRAVRADERWRDLPLFGLTATNNPMATVTLDAPVFFKPGLESLEQAVVAHFEPAPARAGIVELDQRMRSTVPARKGAAVGTPPVVPAVAVVKA